MKVVILGCGRMGAMVAVELFSQGHEVSIIDYDSSQFHRLGADYGGKKVVGNGTEQDTLRKAGIETADAFLATTQGDNRNILASQIARTIFHVPNVYTRIKDPSRARCFEQQGLKTVCTTLIASSAVEQALLGSGPGIGGAPQDGDDVGETVMAAAASTEA